MNDEQFEGRMQIVEVEVSQLMANQLRARDTALREEISKLRAALATQPAAGEPVYQPKDEAISEIQMAIAASPDCRAHGLTWDEAVALYDAGYRKFAPPAAAHGDEAVRWVPCSERLPEVAQFDQQEFIVSVQRKDKVITMSALYLNAYPLYCEDHDDADDEGYVPHTGWYDAKSNGDDANSYTLINDSWYGSTVTHWMPMPKPAAAMRAQGDGGEV